jgi:protein O-GlcNAc transferase
MKNYKFILSNLWFWIRKRPFLLGEEPFMPTQEKAAFMRFAESSTHILEYGGGGSTVWANKIGKIGTCVENNRDWLGVIQNAVVEAGIPENLTLLFADTGLTGAYGMPAFGKYTRGLTEKGLTYVLLPYVSTDFKNQFDLVFIDGRWRVACCLFSALMLSRDVVILIDDFDEDRGYNVLYRFFNVKLTGRLAHLTMKPNVQKNHMFRAFKESLSNPE